MTFFFFMYGCKKKTTTFTEGVVNINSNIADAGTISGEGTYKKDDAVGLSTTINDGYSFLGWYENDELLSTKTNYYFIMKKKNYDLTAKYSANKCSIKTSATNGVVQVLPGNVVDYNSEVTLTAIPNPGYEFSGWSIFPEVNVPKTSSNI